MNIRQLLAHSHGIMVQAGIDHALIGGLALGFHGVQRFTNDVDYLVPGKNRGHLKQTFASHGFSVFFENAEVLQLSGDGSLDFLFANRPLSQAMLANATKVSDLDIKCLGVEDLIGLKIQAYVSDIKRELRDKADIQALIENNAELNWEKMKQYADIFSRWEDIEKIRRLLGR